MSSKSSAEASDGEYPVDKVVICMYGPGKQTAENVYVLTHWSPTWVKRSSPNFKDDELEKLPPLYSYNENIWKTHDSALSTNNFAITEWEFRCRWCGVGNDNKSNMNKHEKRCSVVGAPGHKHKEKKCLPGCSDPAEWTPREDRRKNNPGRPRGTNK